MDVNPDRHAASVTTVAAHVEMAARDRAATAPLAPSAVPQTCPKRPDWGSSSHAPNADQEGRKPCIRRALHPFAGLARLPRN
jgi:hypothetical protein